MTAPMSSNCLSMPATSKNQNMIEGAIAVGVVAWAMWKGIRMVTKHARGTQASGVSRQDNTRDHGNTGLPQPAVAVNIETLINQAYERVDSFDWSQWVPDKGDQQFTIRLVSSKPPLTLGMVERYLGFYAWVWGKMPSSKEVERVKGRLITIWINSWIYMDDSIMREVLMKGALQEAILQLPSSEQETIRAILRSPMPEGVYSELEFQPTVAPANGATSGSLF